MSKTPSIFSAIQKIRKLLSHRNKMSFLLITGLSICTAVLEVITASVVMLFAQAMSNPETGKYYLQKVGLTQEISESTVIFYFAVLCGILYLIKSFFSVIEIFYQNFEIQKIAYAFKSNLLEKYTQMDYKKYLTRNAAFGASVITGDAENVFSSGFLAIVVVQSELVVFFSLVSIIIYVNPSLALFIFALGVAIGLFLIKVVLPYFYKWGLGLQDASLQGGKNVLQFFHGFKEIILLRKKKFFVSQYNKHSLKKYKTTAIQSSVSNLPRIIIEVFFVSLFVISVSYLCITNNSTQELLAVMGGYLYAGFRLMPGLNRIVNQLNIFKNSIPSVDRIYDEFSSLGQNEDFLNYPDFEFNSFLGINVSSFRYLNSKKNSLENVKVEIKKGECIGVAGETGSGKSTFVDLILGLMPPDEGEIIIDGKYHANSIQWHEKIGYVPQSIYLTDDSIASNIAFGVDPEAIDYARLKKVISDAQLDSLISNLAHGVDTVVGERGMRLSGGERQRIAIARALYRMPEVLIFDEATSALDTETEDNIMKTIYSVRKGRTVIMVAHRLSTLEKCDRILVFDKATLRGEVGYKDLKEGGKRYA